MADSSSGGKSCKDFIITVSLPVLRRGMVFIFMILLNCDKYEP